MKINKKRANNIALFSKSSNNFQKLLLFSLFMLLSQYFILLSYQNPTPTFTEIDSTEIAKTNLDSLKSDSTNQNLYIDPAIFTYADTKRYTFDGILPYKETQISNTSLIIGGSIFTAAFVGQHIAQAQTIWKDRVGFRIIEDGHYAIYADKIGHFYGTYLSSYVMRELMLGIGFSYDASHIIGASMGLGYTFYVEILDGYGENFGFSPSDMYANLAGASFFLLQHYVPFLQNFTPKFWYIPSELFGEERRKPHDFFIDDYSSHTMWISANIHNMLPDNLKDYWPSWLELSFGYAVRNLCNPHDPSFVCSDKSEPYSDVVRGNPKFIVALDYNLVKILPEGPPIWNWFVQSLNFFKLPSPAIEFGRNETKFMLLYPFSF